MTFRRVFQSARSDHFIWNSKNKKLQQNICKMTNWSEGSQFVFFLILFGLKVYWVFRFGTVRLFSKKLKFSKSPLLFLILLCKKWSFLSPEAPFGFLAMCDCFWKKIFFSQKRFLFSFLIYSPQTKTPRFRHIFIKFCFCHSIHGVHSLLTSWLTWNVILLRLNHALLFSDGIASLMKNFCSFWAVPTCFLLLFKPWHLVPGVYELVGMKWYWCKQNMKFSKIFNIKYQTKI